MPKKTAKDALGQTVSNTDEMELTKLSQKIVGYAKLSPDQLEPAMLLRDIRVHIVQAIALTIAQQGWLHVCYWLCTDCLMSSRVFCL